MHCSHIKKNCFFNKQNRLQWYSLPNPRLTVLQLNFVCKPTQVLNDNIDHGETNSMEHDLAEGSYNNVI